MKVLVTNGEYKHTLAAVRSLNQHGVDVFVTSNYKGAQSFYSRHKKKKFVTTKPEKEKAYIKDLNRIVRDERIDVVLPIGFNSVYAISGNLDKFKDCDVPLQAREKIQAVSNKWEVMKFAKEVSAPIPDTISVDNKKDEQLKDLIYPVVVKGDEGSAFISYCNNRKQASCDIAKLLSLYKKRGKNNSSIIVQEYIPGTGYGYFGLFDNGKELANFQHKRLREFPTSGGSSSKAISVKERSLGEIGKKLLSKLDWHGVAMVEVKKDKRDGKFKLMEINPKFWGSLALAIKCGVDFPYLASMMASGKKIGKTPKYSVGTTYQWVLPDDTLHLLSKPSIFPSYISDMLDPKVGSDLWFTDPIPGFAQLADTLLHLDRAKKDRQKRIVKGAERE